MEQDLPSFQSDVTALQPHSCTCCQKLLIHNMSTYGSVTGKFSYTKVAEMASSGCLLFQTLQTKFDRVSYPACRTRHDLTLEPRTWSDGDILRGLGFRWEMKPEDHQVRGYEDDEEENMLFALVPKDNLAHKFVEASPFNLHPGSAESFAWIKKRFHRCRRRHVECEKRARENRQNLAMPKRLLDVGQLGDPFIRLLEASDDARVSFAIGSYVWGNGLKEDAIKQAQTTKENIGYRIASGIEATGLPKSIQDLIEVTRQIGLRYLWLDAFCIVQDDNDDKDHQFNSLAEFYKQAGILISAASASDCGEGFLQSRTVDRCYGSIFELPYEWKVDGHETRGSLLLSEMDLDGSTDNDPVHMRIWTFQEHLVSSRVISFGSRQIKWTCQQEKNSVDGGNYHEMIGGLEYNLRIAFSPSRYPYETLVEKGWRVMSWMEIVEEYSKRDYSRLEDRVPAFYEAMSLLAPHMGWTRDQLRNLKFLQRMENLDHRGLGRHYPAESSIGSQLRQLGDTNPTIEFQKIDGQPPCLTIEGFVQEADWIGNYTIDVPAEDVQLFQVDLDVEMPPQPVFLLDLSASYTSPFSMGLVLVKIPGYLTRFQRCGRFEAIEVNPDGSHILFSKKGGSFKTITII
ncbi:heterokaryon incompatibility protein-domain-containing protein [Fusarium oxysporum Fo47]|uniref:heterokaryon incompatibility protein-domain-containing protein n=1 Tax=Fusarium oxysporum Fo47 TaxID=660027 RepID=UPI002869DA2F|nr:heterokaryon incompatibility protein-domain-containing protein [Fusarium oxysporum Fo47]QKD57005.2 heterokaryon incompatibility protein-domain-containing protein [Fusarium oxysporum Fo47]